jgi:DNA polymerase-3 subunit delta
MAKPPKQNEEHAFKKMQRDIEVENWSNPLFFYGREQYLIRWATEAVVERFVSPSMLPLDYNKADGGTMTLDALKNLCETLPMGSERRVVVVEDLPAVSGKASKWFSETDEASLADYIKILPDTVLLIFTSEETDKRKKLFKAIQANGGCYEFGKLEQGQLRGFIEKRLRQGGKTAKTNVIDHLIALSGYYDRESDYTMFRLENDLKKAIAHSMDKELTVEDMCVAVSGNSETYVFDLIDALTEGNKGDAFRHLHELLSSGENEYKLLALICSQFETIVMAGELLAEHKRFEEIRALLGLHEFRVRKAVRYAESRSLKRLRSTLLQAYEIDKTIKSGSMDARLALELLIAEA